ncbi:MAG TPA: hypothetical protein VFT42_00145 [Solirubrobacteraceae bacterium]|nr:hypothetical protein [Solirubrobacteraceae bacterium]
MGFVLATTAGLVIWIVLYALGAKGWDGFMITILIAVVAAMVRTVAQYLPGRREL